MSRRKIKKLWVVQRIQKKKKDTQMVSFCTGASDEARTRYLHLGKVALYQMSYTRSDKWYYSRVEKNVKP